MKYLAPPPEGVTPGPGLVFISAGICIVGLLLAAPPVFEAGKTVVALKGRIPFVLVFAVTVFFTPVYIGPRVVRSHSLLARLSGVGLL